jgi:integrase
MWVTDVCNNGVPAMPKTIDGEEDKRTPAQKIADALKNPGKHSFGNSLFLITRPPPAGRPGIGKGYWVQQYRDGTSFRSKSLGTLAKLNSYSKALTAARRFAVKRDDQKVDEAKAEAAGPLFSAMVTDYLDGYERDGEHVPGKAAGWRGTSEADTYRRNLIERGKLGAQRVAAITPEDVAAHLRLFVGKHKTAERVRSHIEAVIAFATARKFRTTDNPANSEGPLKYLSWPKPDQSNSRTVHHPAMPAADVPKFFADLQTIKTPTARVLSFILLTAVRANEACAARWCDFDLEAKVWTAPGTAMKGKGEGHPHAVPLTDAMLAIIGKPEPGREFVFPGSHKGRVGPKNPLHTLRMVYSGEADVHGLRSTFSDWVLDHTEFPDRERLADLALAHYTEDKKDGGTRSQRDYQRSLQAERRQPMMQAWNEYVTSLIRAS